MSESGKGKIENTVRKVKDSYYKSQGLYVNPNYVEWQRDVSSEKLAKQAVADFVNTSSQEPRATFPGESESVFDLGNYEPGTIIRAEYLRFGEQKFDWFVFGNRPDKDSTYLYLIEYPGAVRPGERLEKEREMDIWYPGPTKIHSFPVREAHVELYLLKERGRETREDLVNKFYPTVKIDVMALGKTIKSKEPKKVSQKAKLELATQNI